MQLENGPAATCLCDIQEQQKQSRMDPGYKKILLNPDLLAVQIKWSRRCFSGFLRTFVLQFLFWS